jgi:tellurite resistance protein
MQHTPRASSAPWIARIGAPLEHLFPAWFALVMGWTGLAQAWLRGSDLLGDMALGLALVAGGFAALIFCLLCLASVWRVKLHLHAVIKDLQHPIRHAFMATFPVSVILLAALGASLFQDTNATLELALAWFWCAGSLLEFVATVWVISRWLRPQAEGGLQWSALTPALFIPVVGNVLAPLGGVPLGFESWATAQFGIGLLLWPILQTLLFVRWGQVGPLPAKLSPTLFICVAPPSAVGLSLLVMQAPAPLAWAAWGMALFFLALTLTQLGPMRAQPFGMSFWGMSFPLAAFSALTLRLASTAEGAWLQLPALGMLALTSLVILGLTLGTWRGLRNGRLLVADA